MNKEQENVDVLEEELVENEKSLLLINDDVNTFEYVIDTLMKVCHHSREQAETSPGLHTTKANAPSCMAVLRN